MGPALHLFPALKVLRSLPNLPGVNYPNRAFIFFFFLFVVVVVATATFLKAKEL